MTHPQAADGDDLHILKVAAIMTSMQ